MLAEDAEDAVVLVVLQGLQIGCQRLGLATRELQLATHLGVGADIKFGDVDVLHQLRILGDGSINVLFRRSVDVVVALHTDAMDGYASLLHLLHHIVDAVALAGVALVIVVVEQQRIGVGLVGILESLGNELIAAELPVLALAVGIARLPLAVAKLPTGIVADGLVHHVPAVDHILVAVDHGVDVLTQTLVEHFLLNRTSFLVLEHPVGELRVPAEAVSAQLDATLAGKVGNRVCPTPVPDTFGRMDGDGLHVVLGCQAVELLSDERHLLGS